jgi:hypothetical protein
MTQAHNTWNTFFPNIGNATRTSLCSYHQKTLSLLVQKSNFNFIFHIQEEVLEVLGPLIPHLLLIPDQKKRIVMVNEAFKGSLRLLIGNAMLGHLSAQIVAVALLNQEGKVVTSTNKGKTFELQVAPTDFKLAWNEEKHRIVSDFK